MERNCAPVALPQRVQRMDTASTVERLLVGGRVRKLLPTVPVPSVETWRTKDLYSK